MFSSSLWHTHRNSSVCVCVCLNVTKDRQDNNNNKKCQELNLDDQNNNKKNQLRNRRKFCVCKTKQNKKTGMVIMWISLFFFCFGFCLNCCRFEIKWDQIRSQMNEWSDNKEWRIKKKTLIGNFFNRSSLSLIGEHSIYLDMQVSSKKIFNNQWRKTSKDKLNTALWTEFKV